MNKLLSLAVASSVALCAGVAAAQTKWDLPAGYPATNFHSKNLVEFASDVRKATGGKVDITVHPGASLFKVPEIKRAVQTGQAPIGELLMSLMENEDAIFGVDVVPFLATSYADSEKLWKAARPTIEKKLGAQGLTVLYAVPWPPQGIYAKKDLNTIEDMKGLKFRAYNVGTSRIAELVGAQPVTIQAAELAQALATGVVNSFISSGSTGRDTKVWESLEPLVRHAGLAAEQRDHGQHRRPQQARRGEQEGCHGRRCGGRGARAQDEHRGGGLVEEGAELQRHEGAAAEPGPGIGLQEDRRDAHRGLAQESRRRRQGRRRLLQEDDVTRPGPVPENRPRCFRAPP